MEKRKLNAKLGALFISVVFGLMCSSFAEASSAPVEVHADDARMFDVSFKSGPIVIDGKLDESAWETSLAFNGFRWHYEDMPKTSDDTTLRVTYDDANFYLAFQCFEKDIDKLTAMAPADGCINHQDDRVEIQFDMLRSDHAPMQYAIFNCEGVMKTLCCGGGSRDGWRPKVEKAWGRGDGFWTLEIRFPLTAFGKDNLAHEVCEMAVSRMNSQGIMTLAPTKPTQSIGKNRIKLHFEPRQANHPLLTSLSRGALALDGFLTGTNEVNYEFRNLENAETPLVLEIENLAEGQPLKKETKKIMINDAYETASMYYHVLGEKGEVVRFSIHHGKTGKILYSSRNELSVLNPINRTYQTPDPLFEDLLDKSREKDPRLNGSMAYGNEIGYRFATFQAAMAFGAAYSIEEIMREEKESQLHCLSYADWSKDVKPLEHTWDKAWQPEGILHWLVEGHETKGWSEPMVYANYYVVGVDDEGKRGVGPNAGYGYTFDPVNSRAYLDAVEHVVRTYGDSLWAVFAGDEQFDQNCHRLVADMKKNYNSAAADSYLKRINEEVKREFGFGKYGIPFDIDQKHPDYPFCQGAFIRWLQSKIRLVNKRLGEIVKSINPALPVMSEDLMYGLGGDLTYFDEYADLAAFQLILPFFTKKQNWMFRTKFVKDLSGLDYVLPCPHEALDGYQEGSCNPSEMLELYSQLVRGGATGVLAWPAAYNGGKPPSPYSQSAVIGDPYAWDFMIAILKTISELPPLKFPKPDSAIFVSTNSLQCKDNRYPAYWTHRRYDHLFNQLGTGSRAWFKFVAGDRLERRKETFDGYKVVYAPDLKYSVPEMAERLYAYCENGGTLVCLGPDAFEFNVNGESLTEFRRKLFGVKIDGSVESKFVTFDMPGLKRTLKLLTLDLKKLSIVDTNAVSALATFADGSPAVVEKKIGEGRAIFFAYLPVNDVSVSDAESIGFWTDFHQALGCSTGHDIWRFKLPMPELKTKLTPEVPKDYCLTGNYGFWSRCFFYGENSRFNLNLDGLYFLTVRNKKTGPFTLRNGRLTDRLRAVEYAKALKACGLREAPPYIQPEKWVETIEGGDTVLADVTFSKPCVAKRASVYFNGDINGVEMSSSADKRTWTKIGSNMKSMKTGEHAVAKLDVVLNSSKPMKHFRFSFPARKDKNDALTLVEVELWGDCPELTRKTVEKPPLSSVIDGSFENHAFKDSDNRIRHKLWPFNRSSYRDVDGFYELVDDSFAGRRALRLFANSNGGRGAGVYGQAVGVNPDDVIELSVQVKGDGTFKLGVICYNSEKRFLNVMMSKDEEATSSWKEITTTFTIPSVGKAAGPVKSIRPTLTVKPGADVIFDEVNVTIKKKV